MPPKRSGFKSVGEILANSTALGPVVAITRRQKKIMDAAEVINQDPGDIGDAAWMCRQLIQATLPHSDPGDVPAWTRTNGHESLTIRAGWDHKTGKSIGYPFGTIPRLLMFWLTTEIVRTGKRRIEMGGSLAE